jgi:hypothetical protein
MAIHSLLAESVTEWRRMFIQRHFVRGMTVGAIK